MAIAAFNLFAALLAESTRLREERLETYKPDMARATGLLPNRNLAPLNLVSPTLFTGILNLARGGTNADLSATGPGVLQQASMGDNVTVGPFAFGSIDWASGGASDGQPLLYDAGGPAADFGPLNLAGASVVTGTLPAARGGTGVSNGFDLIIPATGTAALRASAATAGRVGFWSSATALDHDAALLWDSTAKKLTVGGAAALRAGLFFESSATETSAGTQKNGAAFEAFYNPGASQLTVSKIGAAFVGILDGSGGSSAAGSIQGMLCEVYDRQSAGTFSGAMNAANLIARVSAASSPATVNGALATVVLSSSGNVTDWRGFSAASPSLSSTGLVTTAVAFYAAKQKMTGVTTGYGIFQADAADVNFFAGGVVMAEITAPAAPAANQGILYLDDNGAGKSRLMIRFNTGAVQQIAIQP